MKNLDQTKVKTLTIYTKKQITNLFNELKVIINRAYQNQSSHSIQSLLYLLKLIGNLLNVPSFAKQLNLTGDIKITSYLQAIYVKNTMWKSQFQSDIRNYVLYLMEEYSKIQDSGYLISSKFKGQQYKIDKIYFSSFYAQFLEHFYSLNQVQSLTVGISFLKVLIISQITKNRINFEFLKQNSLNDAWLMITKILIKYCRIIENLKNQQISVTLCFWLCSTQKLFSKQCMKQGIVNILKRSLLSKNLTQDYGIKIINFLKLLLTAQTDMNNFFKDPSFQTTIVKFSQKFDNERILSSLRQLMSLHQQKNQINHSQKIYQFTQIFKNKKAQQSIKIYSIHLINIYADSKRIDQFLFNDQNKNTFLKILQNEKNISVLKQLFSICAYTFFKQRGNIQAIELMLKKLSKILESEQYKKFLLAEKKKLLINFIKMIKSLFMNKKHVHNIQLMIRQNQIQKKFFKFSDCTNFKYEKQLLQLRFLLRSLSDSKNNQDNQNQFSHQNLLNQLQKHLISKANYSKSNPKQDQLQQLKLLYNLIIHTPQSSQLKINNQIVNAISKNTFQDLQHSNIQDKGLQILDFNQSFKNNSIKQQINLYSIKIFNELLKIKQFLNYIQNQSIYYKNIRIGLNTKSKETLDQILYFVLKYHKKIIIPKDYQTITLQFCHKALKQSSKSSSNQLLQLINYLKRKNNIKLSPEQLLQYYLKKIINKQQINESQTQQIFMILKQLKLNQQKQYFDKLYAQNFKRNNILGYLQAIYNFSKFYNLQIILWQLCSSRFKQIYVSQLESPRKQISQQIKNKIYLILQKLFDQNIVQNFQQFNYYFKNVFIKKNNPQITKESIIFIEKCLELNQNKKFFYENNNQRQSDYLKFLNLNNNNKFIGIQCALFISQKPQIQQKFLLNYHKIIKDKLFQNKFHQNFILIYSKNCSNQLFQKYNFIEILDEQLTSSKSQFKIILSKINNSNIIDQVQAYNIFKKLFIKICIIYNFNCSQKIILKQSQYQHSVREIIDFLNIFKIQNKKQIFNKLSANLKKVIVKIIRKSLSTLIYIYKNPLKSNKILPSQFQFIIQNLFNNLIFLDSDQINQLLSQILRLILLKSKQKQYSKTRQLAVQAFKQLLNLKNTEKGKQHLNICQIILSLNPSKDKQKFKQLIFDYFLFQQEPQQQIINQYSNIQTQKESLKQRQRNTLRVSIFNRQISDSQLIKHLKNLLAPPYVYGINTLIKFMRQIRSKQYSQTLIEVFIQSKHLYEEDIQNKEHSLQKVRQIIISMIHQDFCQINNKFYDLISMGKQASYICLRKKNIRVRGIRIICDQIIKALNNDSFTHYAQILTIQTHTTQEFDILKQNKIPSIVNEMYRKKSIRPQFCQKLGNLIGHSSKSKQIQKQYSVNKDIYENLNVFRKNNICLISTISAISGLVYLNQQNQKFYGTQKTFKYILDIINMEQNNVKVCQKGYKFIANLIHKNKSLNRQYFDFQVDKNALRCLQNYCRKQNYSFLCLKQILRLLGSLSLTTEGGFKIIKMNFLDYCHELLELSLSNKGYQLIVLFLSILFNITNNPDNSNIVTIKLLYEQKIIQFFIQISLKCLHNEQILALSIDTLQNLFRYEFISKQVHNIKQMFMQIIQSIAQIHQSNQNIFKKWSILLYLLFSNKNNLFNQIQISKILFTAANYLKTINKVDQKVLQINMFIIQKFKNQTKIFQLIKSGWIQFLIQNLRIKNQTSQNLSKILDILIELNDKNFLNSFTCTKLFQILIKRLELQYKDQNARKLILLLKRIKQKTVVNSQTGVFLLQFSIFFLTQGQLLLSPRYHRRVRQIISILAYFLTYNIELKLIFRDQGLIKDVLKDWIKVDSMIQEQSSIGESCRMCLFAIYNDQTILDRNVDFNMEQKALQQLQKGVKCTLYRRDGSNKTAILKIDKNKNQIIAYKHPNGQIKPKYIIPFQNILITRYDYEQVQDDILLKQTVFNKKDSLKGLNIFSKKIKNQFLLTLIGMVGEELSIRQINVQFDSIDKKNTFINYLKIVKMAFDDRSQRSNIKN